MKRICIALIGLSIGVTCNTVAVEEIGTAPAVTMQADGDLANLPLRERKLVDAFIKAVKIVQGVVNAAKDVKDKDSDAIESFCDKVDEMIGFGKDMEVLGKEPPSESAARYLVDYFGKQGVNPLDVFASLYQELTRLSQANYFGNARLKDACENLIPEIGEEQDQAPPSEN